MRGEVRGEEETRRAVQATPMVISMMTQDIQAANTFATGVYVCVPKLKNLVNTLKMVFLFLPEAIENRRSQCVTQEIQSAHSSSSHNTTVLLFRTAMDCGCRVGQGPAVLGHSVGHWPVTEITAILAPGVSSLHHRLDAKLHPV